MLPAASHTSTPPTSLQPAVARTRSRVVLVASSDSSLRERLRQSLGGLRWQVLEAGGVAEAWVASQETQLEALLIDPWLPDMDVAEFLEDFHREHPNVDLMMTDGVTAANSPRSAYHQELLYSLRRSQESGDTAAWNTAPALGEGDAGRWPMQDLSASRMALPNRWVPPVQPQPPSSLPSSLQAVSAGAGRSMAPPSASSPAQSDSWNRAAQPHARQASAFVPPVQADPASQSHSHELSAAAAGPDLASPRSALEAEQRPSLAKPAPLPVPSSSRRAGETVERIPELIGSSPSMLEVSRRIRLVAGRSTPVLIEGPTGSGKELVAEALHRLSTRSRKPFVAINCAAIPEALLEAELFGHTRGAFTGAVQGRMGRIESADGGSLFLDEIGEMPLALQSKLLRFFESGELQRIGDNEIVKVDVRIIAATHQPLAEDAQKGLFRADLYYRLAVFLIHTPALIEHMEDLPQLVEHFVQRMGRKMPVKRIDPSAMAKLSEHGWPGNVRELEHVLERAAILAGDDPSITAAEIDFGLSLMN